MQEKKDLAGVFNSLRKDLRSFISLSLKESETSWEQWISRIKREVRVRCWEMKGCTKTDCPSYKNACGRCWLIAGTMCGGAPIGKFAAKYKSCTECAVYQAAVLSNPVDEVYEHLITLVYSLRDKQLELKSLALHDKLTGLFNRAYFDLVIKQETKKVKRYGGGFTVHIIDIDGFKHINDTYGHLHGDGILREFSLILKDSIRESDLLIRYGGDEFMIISHESKAGHDSGPQDNGIIGRIRRNVSLWNREYGSEDYGLSFSHGWAAFNKEKDLKEVIGLADAKMYENKEQNRKNRKQKQKKNRSR